MCVHQGVAVLKNLPYFYGPEATTEKEGTEWESEIWSLRPYYCSKT
jgi:hypothetical protein